MRDVLNRLSGEAHHAISINQKLLDAALVRELRQAAPMVMTWPINSLERLAGVRNWGVTGAISDRLAIVRTIVGARGDREASGSGEGMG